MASLDVFLMHIDAWRAHCAMSRLRSDISAYTDCTAFDELVAMGPDILPYLKTLAEASPDAVPALGLPALLHGIAGDAYAVPREMQGRVEQLRAYSIAWLRENAYGPSIKPIG